MKSQIHTAKCKRRIEKISVSICVNQWLIAFLLFSVACNQLEKPKPAPFYAETAPSQKKEFRWSNGKMPKSFDPAFASAPPETDVVRAIYEGLTDTDPKTLNAVSAIAVDWKSTDDFKTWTFNLRRDARWSNGERVTAQNFVRSWKRLAEMKGKVSHPELLQNIVGMKIFEKEIRPSVEGDSFDVLSKPSTTESSQILPSQTNSNSSNVLQEPPETNSNTEQKPKIERTFERKYGVEAIDNFTLKISLVKPDKDFPALVAHPIFRPIYGHGKEFETGKLNANIVTSGAFRVFSVGQDGITLDRAENYWNTESVEIERVRFVPTENAEKALEAYRAGEVDAVTNADFEPLALKLLTPYEDFQRTPHAALNFYEFNLKKPPFDDRRVREALAIAIERERLTEDEMGDASQPALSFLPFSNEKTKLVQDANRAKNLLAETGFAKGENFPTIKLLVNRNNVQQRIARSVAKMWKQNLNIETEIIVKDSTEITSAWASDDYALVRRGAVIPTTNESANMSAIFLPEDEVIPDATIDKSIEKGEVLQSGNSNTAVTVVASEQSKIEGDANQMPSENSNTKTAADGRTISTEAQAIVELHAIPLYFPTSYSLVKPYIQGFDINVLDAPSLKNVKIDNSWQPKKAKSES
ncbi:MAG: peptide ABC transporter substrate-binding protein [Acidobacteria bacterium]|jgi:oligopeptide transport system substrate-binding protein|nr:peptide ABC transporter substrate-binding protein [Acidobacteriota bacterium]